MPLAIDILLRQYYDKVLKDKVQGRITETSHVPLRLKSSRHLARHLLSLTHSRESPFFLPIYLNLTSIHLSPALPNRTLWTRQQSTSLPYHSILAQPSCACNQIVKRLQQLASAHARGAFITRRAPHRSAVMLPRCQARARTRPWWRPETLRIVSGVCCRCVAFFSSFWLGH